MVIFVIGRGEKAQCDLGMSGLGLVVLAEGVRFEEACCQVCQFQRSSFASLSTTR